LAKEAASAEKKMLRELNESPDSVAAIKKIWSYKKLDDGTLKITSYKGSENEVIIPAKIGNAKVSVIGEKAFTCDWYIKVPNRSEREKITSVIIPEGVCEIEEGAFCECISLASVTLPSTIERIGEGAFSGCEKLYKNKLMILSNVLVNYECESKIFEVPEGVTRIERASRAGRIEKFILPKTVTTLADLAFFDHITPCDISIPNSVKNFGVACLGYTDPSFNFGGGGLTIHTTEGAPVVKYAKEYYPDAIIKYDYGNEDYRQTHSEG
jgi:hypothetical protein